MILVIILLIISTLMGASGAILFKKASKDISLNLKKLITNWPLILGAVLYAGASIVFVYALKLEELSVLYPMTALSYVWATIGAWRLYKENITTKKIIGIALIILGVVVITIK